MTENCRDYGRLPAGGATNFGCDNTKPKKQVRYECGPDVRYAAVRGLWAGVTNYETATYYKKNQIISNNGLLPV